MRSMIRIGDRIRAVGNNHTFVGHYLGRTKGVPGWEWIWLMDKSMKIERLSLGSFSVERIRDKFYVSGNEEFLEV